MWYEGAVSSIRCPWARDSLDSQMEVPRRLEDDTSGNGSLLSRIRCRACFCASSGKLFASLLFLPLPNAFSSDSYPILTVGWTLNFEMAFYLLISLALLFRSELSNWWVASAGVALLMLPRVHQVVGLGPWSSVFGDQLIYAFPIGLAAGCLVLRLRSKIAGMGKCFLGFGFGLCALLVAVLDEVSARDIPFAFYFGYGDFLIAGCLILSATCFESQLSKLPCVRFWRRLGDTSYSTYLYHIMAIAIALEIFGGPMSYVGELRLIIFSTGLTLLFSELSFRIIEQRQWLLPFKVDHP